MMNELEIAPNRKQTRTHIGISPTNHRVSSSYSDRVDSRHESESPSFDDQRNGRNMRFFDIDVEEDDDDEEEEVRHDQLPSVEEAKAHLHLKDDAHRRRGSKKLRIILWGMVLLGILAMAGLVVTRRSQHAAAVKAVTQTVRLSHPAAFLDAKSPQSRALRWMLHRDERKLPLPVRKSDPFVQRYVLAVLVFSLTTSKTQTSPASLASELSKQTNTRDAFGLLSGVHECEWNSEWDKVATDYESGNVVVGTERVRLGILCGDTYNDGTRIPDSVAQAILLPSAGLEGELPPELEVLPHLESVDLSHNKIEGNLPPMPYLTDLSLAHNELTGYLPDHFSEMTRLQRMSLSENALQGSLPYKFAALTDLEILALNGNQLTGGLSEVYALTKLQELYLANNFFEDHLSNGSFEELSDLRLIDAKTNRLSGPLPNALWKLTNLEVIDLYDNALDGHINNVIVEGHPLKYLDVSKNVLGGGLPTSISNLKGLTHLDVSYNRLDARLQPHLAGMTSMKTLLLTEEDRLGPQPLPEWLRGMKDLKQLSFRLATRTGTIPTWFGELTSLELLDLDWNHISGSIPTELGRLTNLKYLMLNRNRLTGTVPTEVSQLPRLEYLMLDTNDLEGSLLASDGTACRDPATGWIENLVADCGHVQDNGSTEGQEVECPCCTECCWDNALRCNMKDWVLEVEDEYRGSYDRYRYEFDHASYVPVA